jgi:hypothetical protein
MLAAICASSVVCDGEADFLASTDGDVGLGLRVLLAAAPFLAGFLCTTPNWHV